MAALSCHDMLYLIYCANEKIYKHTDTQIIYYFVYLLLLPHRETEEAIIFFSVVVNNVLIFSADVFYLCFFSPPDYTLVTNVHSLSVSLGGSKQRGLHQLSVQTA